MNGLNAPRSKWLRLVEQREATPRKDRRRQNQLAGKEHAAFAEYSVRKNPLNALAMMAYIPGYAAAKGIGAVEGWSDPGLEQMAAGYRGLGRGLVGALGEAMAPAAIAETPGQQPVAQLIAERAKAAGLDPGQAVAEWLRDNRGVRGTISGQPRKKSDKRRPSRLPAVGAVRG